MRPHTIAELKKSFSHEELEQWVDPQNVDWDEIDFLAWKHPQGGNYFVCVPARERLYGMVFRMNAGAGNLQGQCDLCHASNNDQGVKLATVETQDNPRRQIGFHVCADMACSERIRGLRFGIFMYETISSGKRMERLQLKIERFARKVAGEEQSAAHA